MLFEDPVESVEKHASDSITTLESWLVSHLFFLFSFCVSASQELSTVIENVLKEFLD